MKRAQELSITTIVIAALAVLVLVVLAVVFAGRVGVFAKEVTVNCVSQGGLCRTSCDQTESQIYKTKENKGLVCPDENPKCCMEQTLAEQRGFKTTPI